MYLEKARNILEKESRGNSTKILSRVTSPEDKPFPKQAGVRREGGDEENTCWNSGKNSVRFLDALSLPVRLQTLTEHILQIPTVLHTQKGL